MLGLGPSSGITPTPCMSACVNFVAEVSGALPQKLYRHLAVAILRPWIAEHITVGISFNSVSGFCSASDFCWLSTPPADSLLLRCGSDRSHQSVASPHGRDVLFSTSKLFCTHVSQSSRKMHTTVAVATLGGPASCQEDATVLRRAQNSSGLICKGFSCDSILRTCEEAGSRVVHTIDCF